MPEPKVVIVTAPSGAGKTTMVRRLLERLPGKLSFSISATTRPMRDHEREGVHYYFLTPERFLHRVAQHDFVEWEEVYPGRYYGTLLQEIERIAGLGMCALFDVDVKGALSLKEKFGPQALAVFIQPPTKEHLRHRLESRGTESAAEIEVRMQRADYELAQAPKFDRVVINDDLETALDELTQAVEAFTES